MQKEEGLDMAVLASEGSVVRIRLNGVLRMVPYHAHIAEALGAGFAAVL